MCSLAFCGQMLMFNGNHYCRGHPPKNPNHLQPDTSSGDKMKQSLKKAILHYAADKQDKEIYGMEW